MVSWLFFSFLIFAYLCCTLVNLLLRIRKSKLRLLVLIGFHFCGFIFIMVCIYVEWCMVHHTGSVTMWAHAVLPFWRNVMWHLELNGMKSILYDLRFTWDKPSSHRRRQETVQFSSLLLSISNKTQWGQNTMIIFMIITCSQVFNILICDWTVCTFVLP